MELLLLSEARYDYTICTNNFFPITVTNALLHVHVSLCKHLFYLEIDCHLLIQLSRKPNVMFVVTVVFPSKCFALLAYL